MFTPEFFEVYKAYELKVHKKEREPCQVKRFLCNSPLFDPANELDQPMINSHAIFTSTLIDRTFRTFKDEGVYPAGFGTYHMYHRIDGELAAIGVLDITREFVDSCYFI
jgi:arginyl-tRNA--protein-N-Asp/Glu arginylyltransferase